MSLPASKAPAKPLLSPAHQEPSLDQTSPSAAPADTATKPQSWWAGLTPFRNHKIWDNYPDLLTLLEQAEASCEAKQDMVKLRDHIIQHQTSNEEDIGEAAALQWACLYGMPETCRLVLHYFDVSCFRDNPFLWLLMAEPGSKTKTPMVCPYNSNQIARVLFSCGWQLPPHAGAISGDMAHFSGMRTELGNAKRPSDALVPKQVHAIKRLPFMAVGHKDIAVRLQKIIYRHFVRDSGRPLVLMFAGPSGHGKTEMARAIARLFEKKPFAAATHTVIPCASINTDTELFGLGGAYQGSKQASQLNKLIKEHQRATGVVILDEFEKLERGTREGFLEPFDTGAHYACRLCCYLCQVQEASCHVEGCHGVLLNRENENFQNSNFEHQPAGADVSTIGLWSKNLLEGS